ncbi:MAG TPA: hypothetical protein PK957_02140 [Candidatus Dojkabacteria bacterium]|nr:hypothetical protein [Candidatus Dojkabacteria bacterium]HQF37113.1 hypothetical protein [Candidatus Dojkabacteria bacterium]
MALKEVKPNCVVVMGTCNDYELGIDVKEHTSNLDKMFKRLEKSCDLFIYSPDIYSADRIQNERYIPYLESALGIPLIREQKNINGYKIYSQYDWKRFYTLEKAPNELSEEELKTFNETKMQAIDKIHPNALGNVYIAKMFLEELYGIEVDPERYLASLRGDKIKYPIIN